MHITSMVVLLLEMAAPAQLMAARTVVQDDEVTMLLLDEGDDVAVENGDASQIFIAGEDTAPVKDANEKNPGSGVTHIAEIRTKLKFKGNKVELRNPQTVPTLIQDIEDVKA